MLTEVLARLRESLVGMARRRIDPSEGGQVVCLRGGDVPAFFCVHGVGGNVLGFVELLRHMRSRRRFYAVQAVGVDGRQAPLRSVAQMASLYLDEIRRVQPSGPYYLGGLCFGGVVAYEMAQQLVACNESVALLVVLDTRPPGVKVRGLLGVTLAFLRRGRISGMQAALRRRLMEQLRLHRKELFGSPQERYSVAVLRANQAAEAKYRVRPFAGRVTLVRMGSEHPVPHFQETWGQLAMAGLDVRVLAGGHLDILGSAIASLGGCLDELLAEPA